MTAGQFFLGLVAILIATVVYRWQKNVDLQMQLLAEQRRLVAAYSSQIKIAYFEQPFLGDETNHSKIDEFYSISVAEQKCYVLRDEIYMLCNEAVVDATIKLDNAFREWKIAFPHASETAYDAIADARQKHDEFKKQQMSYLQVVRSEMAPKQNSGVFELIKSALLISK